MASGNRLGIFVFCVIERLMKDAVEGGRGLRGGKESERVMEFRWRWRREDTHLKNSLRQMF